MTVKNDFDKSSCVFFLKHTQIAQCFKQNLINPSLQIPLLDRISAVDVASSEANAKFNKVFVNFVQTFALCQNFNDTISVFNQ